MFRQTHFGFDWGEFITGIALLIAAVVMLRHPNAAILTLTFIFAIIAIIRGIATLAGFNKLHELTGGLAWVSGVAGVFDIILGILFLLDLPSGVITLSYVFAIWFLVDSIANLLNSGHLRAAGTGWFIANLLLDIISVVVGILLLMQPVVSLVGLVFLLAMFFIIWGVNAIVLAFARRNI